MAPCGMKRERRGPNSTGLVRDLEILDALATSDPQGVGVVRIATMLGREKTQVSRALTTLASAGMVERDVNTLAYRLGWKLHTLAARTFESRLATAADATLRKLTITLDAASHLFVLRGGAAIAIRSQACDTTPHTWQWLDRPLPAPTTSPGRVLISEWDEESVRLRFSDSVLGAYAEPHQLRTSTALLEELRVVRQRGYSVLRQEFEVGWVGCAAPVRDHHHRIVAAINVEGPTRKHDRHIERIAQVTAVRAAELTAMITQAPPQQQADSDRDFHLPEASPKEAPDREAVSGGRAGPT